MTKMIICIDCGQYKPHEAFKRCKNCYRLYKRPKLNNCKCGCGGKCAGEYIKGHNIYQLIGKCENHNRWKGGRYKDETGYWFIKKPDHPFCDKRGYVLEHRLIYEHYLYILFDEHIYIPKEIDIHHIDPVTEDYCNNNISNLLPVTKAEHRIIEQTIDMDGRRCSWCGKDTKIIKKNNRPHWYYIDNELTCMNCYSKIRRNST